MDESAYRFIMPNLNAKSIPSSKWVPMHRYKRTIGKGPPLPFPGYLSLETPVYSFLTLLHKTCTPLITGGIEDLQGGSKRSRSRSKLNSGNHPMAVKVNPENSSFF